MKSLARIILPLLFLAIAGCVTEKGVNSFTGAHISLPIGESGPTAPIKILLVDDIPSVKDYMPIQAALAPDSKIIVVQSEGGILFLPVLGAMNIEDITKKFAEKTAAGFADIDPYKLANAHLNDYPFFSESATSAYRLLPFLFAEICTDQKVRLDLPPRVVPLAC
jgi:hypothetical protein